MNRFLQLVRLKRTVLFQNNKRGLDALRLRPGESFQRLITNINSGIVLPLFISIQIY